MRAVVEHPRGWAAWVLVVLGVVAAPPAAAAQSVLVQGDAAVNVGYTQVTRSAVQVDPTADTVDIPASSTSQLFTEIRPGISLQTGSPRLTWRAGYVFSGNLSLNGEQLATYSNAANAALAAELSSGSLLTVSASITQGGTSFLLSQRAADSGQPELRAPGNPNLISGTVVEALSWQLRRHLSIEHTLIGSASAPQDALDQRNAAVTATLAIQLPYERDVYGIEAHASVSWLRPLQLELAPYMSLTNALFARWNHDFTSVWNGLVTAGVEQVFTDTGSRPLAILPSGSASLHYTLGDVGAAVDFTHGTATNLQVGSVSLTDALTARGSILLDNRKARTLGFSAGFLHNEPIGDINPLVAAGTGNAVQGDAGFTTSIRTNLLATARYSIAYQFGQGGSIAPTLVHVFLVGVTGTYKNTTQTIRPLLTRGRRVDGSDGVGFPVVEDVPTSQ